MWSRSGQICATAYISLLINLNFRAQQLNNLLVQVIATVFAIVFSAAVTFILFKIVDSTVGLRVDKRVEEEGLDIYEHGESAYNR